VEHDGIHELTAAYALNALDPRDEDAYEEHLRHCADCQQELASLQEAASALAYATDAPRPPSDLRTRILAEARSERPNVVPLRPRWVLPAAASVAAVAASVAIALGVWAASLSGQLEDERQARASIQRASAILAETDATRIPISGARGTLVVAPTGDAALVVSGLESAPDDKTHEAWVIERGRPEPAGIFDAQAGRTVVALTRPVPKGAIVAVTLERSGGVSQPTGTPLFTAEAA
jgi:anti-sigma-K factor RskA